MAVTLINHARCTPALFGALAATVALAKRADLMHLPVAFEPEDGADSIQMVASAGALVPSGLLWYERVTGRDIAPVSSLEDILNAAAHRDIVVPWSAAHQSGSLLQDLLDQAGQRGIAVACLHSAAKEQGWCVLDHEGQPNEFGLWSRDRYGRWAPYAINGSTDESRQTLTIALLGAESDQSNVYPATLAALGDAADAMGVSLDVRFVSPASLDRSVLASVSGLLLPGGCDMINVPGQIEAASHGLSNGLPTLGLCLGMQSMTTAFAQTLPGLEHANMAEAAPDAAIKTFVPMEGIQGLEAHRLGTRSLTFNSSALKHQYQNHLQIRCNHRFMLNPDIAPALEDAGLNIFARDVSGRIADAIDMSNHPFFKGMQGHPEISSRAGNPHPLITEFLQAAQAFHSQAY